MKRFLRLFLTLAVLVGALALPLSASAGGEKVTICHMPNTPDEVTLTVSVNALPAHLAHGDYQGACTHVKVLTCPFEATAIPVIGSDFVKFTMDVPVPPTPGGMWWSRMWSSTGQYFQFAPTFSGYPPPSDFYVIPGEIEGRVDPTLWDIYVMKANPEDSNFDLMISCMEVMPPP